MLEELDAGLTDEQRAAGLAVAPRTPLEKIDRFMAYGITVVGGCLIVGLLARLAAVAGRGFFAQCGAGPASLAERHAADVSSIA